MDGRASYETRANPKEDLILQTRDNTAPMGINIKHSPFQRFGTIYAKYFNLMEKLNWEEQEKYSMRYTAKSKAKNDLISVPACFDHCMTISDDTSLSADEKNCMRECYFKK